jgi:hypothetical protein
LLPAAPVVALPPEPPPLPIVVDPAAPVEVVVAAEPPAPVLPLVTEDVVPEVPLFGGSELEQSTMAATTAAQSKSPVLVRAALELAFLDSTARVSRRTDKCSFIGSTEYLPALVRSA